MFYYDEPALNWSICETDAYWNEKGQAEISQKGEKEILEATWVLHNMALEAVDKVVADDNLLRIFNINEHLWPAVKKNWKDNQQDFHGRFDFSWDGVNPPKMLEYNADTPSLLLETGWVSKDWFSAKHKFNNPTYHESNYIEEVLPKAMNYLVDKCKTTGSR